MELNDKIIIYTASDGQTAIDVKLENETVWLNVNQMTKLFENEASNIRRHIINVFKDGELEKESNVHFLHVPFSDKPVPYYSLDVIISVGYRVKSKRGTQFRIWANRILKDYLVKGYAINNSIASRKYEELCHLVQILGRTVNSQRELTTDESHELINVVSDYTYALDTHAHRLKMQKYNQKYVYDSGYVCWYITLVYDQYGNGEATLNHHIFPKYQFLQLAHILENLIQLTAMQYHTLVHHNNKTQQMNCGCQLTCLLVKADTEEKFQKTIGDRCCMRDSSISGKNIELDSQLLTMLSFLNIKTMLVQLYNAA